jgi:hypothetical protein
MKYLILVLVFLAGCTLTAPTEVKESKPTRTPTKEWPTDYELAIHGAVTSAMTSMSNEQMTPMCPKWKSLSEIQRKQFYADLLFATTKFESNYSPISMYWEKTMDADDVTGEITISEGLLQLSYQDEPWAKCGFDYKKDKDKHLADLKNRVKLNKQSWKSLHPDKTILNPERNLICGIKIMNYRVNHKKLQGQEFQKMMGAYWAAIRDHGPEIKSMMKARGSECF